jgi:signal transduction histidine kinase
MGPLLVLAIGVMAAGAVIARRAIQNFAQLRQRLIDVHEGRERVVTGSYLKEVQPVVSAVNGLLEHQERRVREALDKAGDLAHGLKTPLAVLSHEAERAAADGQTALASTVAHEVERMHRYIDYHLAHARAAASGATPGAHCVVADSVDALLRTLARLYHQRGPTCTSGVPAEHVARVRREDLDEMLGNVLDNACKWGSARVDVTSTLIDSHLLISVDDDGPGIPEALREAVLRRGVRADEASPGTGLGLSIVRELAELYHGSITLDQSTLGGLRVILRVPSATITHSASVQAE